MRTLFLISLLTLSSGCTTRIGRLKPTRRAELLATEQNRLSEFTDPTRRMKSYSVITEVLLSFAVDSAKVGEATVVNRRLQQYVVAIRDARNSLKEFDQEPQAARRGFEQLEVATRERIKVLQSLRTYAPSESRTAIQEATELTLSIQNEMKELLHKDAPGGKRPQTP